MTRELQPSDYQHTRVLGFSVTRSIWSGFYAAIPNPSAWELLWYSGGSVDVWADPNSHAWTSRDMGGAFLVPSDPGGQGGLINGISDTQDPTVGTSAIDRVVLNVSGLAAQAADPVLGTYNGGARPSLGLTSHDTTGYPPGGYSHVVSDWVAYIGATIANIRSKYPNCRMILLQPNIAGPSFGICTDPSNNNSDSIAFGIRCTDTTRYIRSAISALTKANVRGGFGAFASGCSDFADWAGHLVATGAPSPQTLHGQQMAAYYQSNL